MEKSFKNEEKLFTIELSEKDLKKLAYLLRQGIETINNNILYSRTKKFIYNRFESTLQNKISRLLLENYLENYKLLE